MPPLPILAPRLEVFAGPRSSSDVGIRTRRRSVGSGPPGIVSAAPAIGAPVATSRLATGHSLKLATMLPRTSGTHRTRRSWPPPHPLDECWGMPDPLCVLPLCPAVMWHREARPSTRIPRRTFSTAPPEASRMGWGPRIRGPLCAAGSCHGPLTNCLQTYCSGRHFAVCTAHRAPSGESA